VKTESEIAVKIGIVAALLVLAGAALAFGADPLVTSWVNTHASRSIRHSAVLISRIGDWPAHVAAGIIGAIGALFARRKDWARIFLAMLIACALAGVVARMIKIATGRARPPVKTEQVWNGPRIHANYNAFPSGHTASSTAFFVTLFLARRKIGAPFLIIPLLIAAARIFAGAHYLSDVLFAAALGVVCAVLIWRATLLFAQRGQRTEPLQRCNDSTL
jgi:membrane-associated phospholipid phosphatase